MSVEARNISKSFGNFQALRKVNLKVNDGELVALLGPSGSGKTTLLRIIAGLEEADPDSTSAILFHGENVTASRAGHRRVGFVFQHYALFRNMTVFENIAFGLKMRGSPKDTRRQRVEEIARVLGLEELLGRKPGVLSGGQRQRVAMGRAIVRDPSVFLMDEPLSNLDAKLRVQMRSEIARIQRELGTTTIYVTHDQIEAMTMGTRVAVMRKGRLQQVAAPQVVYEHPTNLFVASFIGSPSMNLVHGTILGSPGQLKCSIGDDSLTLPADTEQHHPGLTAYVGRSVAVGIRPDDLSEPGGGANSIRAVIEATELLGSTRLVYGRANTAPVITEEVKEIAADVDASTVQTLEQEARAERALLVATFDPKTKVEVGDLVPLTVDEHALHFFDLETAEAIA
jgi:multiple sugar transport system ATP-binding protein